jgi:hypothetical protein
MVPNQAYASYDVVYGTNGKPESATYTGGMTETWTYSSGGALQEIAYAGVLGRTYTALANFYDSTGALAISDQTLTDGSHLIAGHANGLTIGSDGGVDTLSGGGTGETFSLAGAFGHVTLTDFASHIATDTLSLPGAPFDDSFAQLLAGTAFSNGGALITIDANDSVKVAGLTHAIMATNPGAFSFNS